MYCRNCGTRLGENEIFCPNCGSKKELTIEKRKKESLSDLFSLDFISICIIAIVTALYVVVVCYMIAEQDWSVGGLIIIFEIPFGLVMCETVPFINILVSFINARKRFKFLYVIEIILNILTIFAQYEFSCGWSVKNIYFIISILPIIISTILIVSKLFAKPSTSKEV